jgi:hypothetical protein
VNIPPDDLVTSATYAFGDGETVSSSTNAAVTYTYSGPGTFVAVVDYVLNGTRTSTVSEVVSVGMPVPFSSTAETGKLTAPEGTVRELEEWVGSDPERAQIVLDAELEKPNPRKGLLDKLAKLINDFAEEG